MKFRVVIVDASCPRDAVKAAEAICEPHEAAGTVTRAEAPEREIAPVPAAGAPALSIVERDPAMGPESAPFPAFACYAVRTAAGVQWFTVSADAVHFAKTVSGSAVPAWLPANKGDLIRWLNGEV